VRRRKYAFTLVELLVVTGVIAILLSLLLPTVAGARRSAQRVACLSNLREIGLAFSSYLGQNRDHYPRPAQLNVAKPEDWIWWESTRAPQGKGVVQRLLNESILHCPADDPNSHRQLMGGIGTSLWTDVFRMSYSINGQICRLWPAATLRTSQVRRPSDKILAVCESSATIDDGCWMWQPNQGSGANVLSRRHERTGEGGKDEGGLGNVLFADGHAATMDRRQSFSAAACDPSQ
jgi:prepilin-type N-terminal cleavage/methylation domain-containing protein/prepilin-type processing-associated H-X9-DG protein